MTADNACFVLSIDTGTHQRKSYFDNEIESMSMSTYFVYSGGYNTIARAVKNSGE